MAEERRIAESKEDEKSVYKKLFKRASILGYDIKANIVGERLEIAKTNRHPLWWILTIVGICVYLIPGLLIIAFWKPQDYCNMIFSKKESGTEITFIINGESGLRFYNETCALLMD
jgi:hypothetical protein